MSESKLMTVELTKAEHDELMRLMKDGDGDEIQDFLNSKVLQGEAQEVEVPPAPKADTDVGEKLRQVLVKVLKQELREQVLKDVLHSVHHLLHSMDGAEIAAAQATGRRALELCCVTVALMEGDVDFARASFIAKEVREIKTEAAKMSCEGNA